MREPRRRPSSAAAHARLRRRAVAARSEAPYASPRSTRTDQPETPTQLRARPAAPYPTAADPAVPNGPRGGSVLDMVRVAIVMMDTSGRFVLWSPAAEELLGWPSETLVGRGLEALLGGDPELLRRGREVIAAVVRDGGWRGPAMVRNSDNEKVALDARLSLLVDGEGVPFVLARLADAGKLGSVERDLALQDALFEQSPLGIAVFDRQLRYVRVNSTLARMNGLPIADHLGRTTGETLPERAADEVSAIQRQVLATGEPVIDLTVAGPDPRKPGFRSISYSRLHDRTGRVLGVTGMIMDVTDRYRAVAKVEHARRRLALLNELGSRIGDLLDPVRIAQELASALVPALADFAGVVLLRAVADGDDLPHPPHTRLTPLVMSGTAAAEPGPLADAMMTPGEPVTMGEGSMFARVLRSGIAEQLESPVLLEDTTVPDDPRLRAAYELGVHSMLVVPLRARGIVLGLLVLSRAGRREGFDRDELAFAGELADRAGSSIDNARLYARERAAALMLQRSLLPQSVPQLPGVEIAHRYVPGSSGTEVGGDWFDVIPLPAGRVALVVGDVMGHGLRAAATMGRLRTAVRTLAGLDLPPATLLQHVHDLADDLAQGPEEALIATCVYAVYDPASRRLVLAKAGHTPPLLIPAGEPAQVLDLPSGTPLGVGGVPFASVELTVAEGTLLVLYTDGLVESRTEDIDVGTARLSTVLEGPHASVEELCDRVVGTLQRGQEPDDVALLLARLGSSGSAGGAPAGAPDPSPLTVAWTLAAEPTAASRARRLVRSTLLDWGLLPLLDTAQLLVSELVTNSVRYAEAPIGLRLSRGRTLLVEVSDPLADPPLERDSAGTDEGGRGLQLVHRLADRWGTRAEGTGKVVWFEQALPADPPVPGG
ncbi:MULTISPECIES: SpoIIE family protein phosphatase [Streptacidiphilus]|uniref:SpoIIE family protein phosphatase n=1 Tax=Streptacidiphilus cavernicola TaxID=3342716 RepID=A0ABV6UHF2_9ACTN|nr:SpoIIE family protein phosphatase [Streptacidiphilus jeojiense]